VSDEYTLDAKYKRDSLIDEHHRYEKALETIVREDQELGCLFCEAAEIARRALGSKR
jgi:hypothetical protein